MYRGFSMAKYKRVMGKLNLNAPTHTANISCTVKDGENVWYINMGDIPVMFEIINVLEKTKPTLETYSTRKYQLIVHRDHFRDKVLTDKYGHTMPLRVEKIVAGTDNGGYDTRVTLNRNISQIEGNDGYSIPSFWVNYGDYADGGYRQYLELNHIETIIYL